MDAKPQGRDHLLLTPQNWVVLQGPEEPPQQTFKRTCQVACFFFVVVGFLKEESVFHDGLPKKANFFELGVFVSRFQVVCVLLLVLLKKQDPQNTEMVDFLVRTLIL